MWANLATQVKTVAKAHDHGPHEPNLKEKLNKDYTFLIQSSLDIAVKQITAYVNVKENITKL